MSANGSDCEARDRCASSCDKWGRGGAWPRRLALPAQKGGNPSIPLRRRVNNISLFISSRGTRPLGHTQTHTQTAGLTCVPISPARDAHLPLPPTPPLPADSPLMSDWASVCVCTCESECVCARRRRCRRDTYGRVEGEGALALENPVSRAGHPDGGHVRDQQLSEVCSHLRIPASGTTVPRSHRSSAVRGEDAIFNTLRRYIPAASRDVTLKNIKIKRQQGRRARGCTRGCEATTPCRLELVCFASSSPSCTKRNVLCPAQILRPLLTLVTFHPHGYLPEGPLPPLRMIHKATHAYYRSAPPPSPVLRSSLFVGFTRSVNLTLMLKLLLLKL